MSNARGILEYAGVVRFLKKVFDEYARGILEYAGVVRLFEKD